MKKRILVIAVALGLMTVAVPASMAEHLSVGFQDTVGTGAEETSNNPSVDADDLALGTTDPDSEDCFQAEGEATPEQAQGALTKHGFCGHIWYNDDTIFEQGSPPDQHYPDDFVGQFDVQRTWYAGNLLLGTCLPMCNDGDGSAQNTTWNAFHTAGAAAGLTEGPEEADDARTGDRFQSYQMQIDLRNAAGIAQSNTGAWEMNGWAHPYATEHFVGFIYDDGGDPITDEQLSSYVNSADSPINGDEDSTPQVCGYTPDITFTSTGEQSFCDTPLLYAGEDPDNAQEGDEPFTSYNDRCDTPTYVCGAAGGAYWEAEAIGLAAYGGDGDEYTAWHWTIAPNQPECANTQPGFDLDLSNDEASVPYLAHDLDVYTPPQAVDASPQSVSVQQPQDYALSFVDDPVGGLPADVSDTVDDAQDTVDETLLPVRKGELLERNHIGAESYAIDDNSREIIDESRDLGDPCAQLIATETEDTVDPWVNYLDSGVATNRAFGVVLGSQGGLGAGVGPVGVYGTDTAAHDSDNDPTTDSYSTSGFVGAFTDKDDDGVYDQILGSSDSTDTFSPPVYQEDNIQASGAYPMLWDMWVQTDGGDAEVNTDQGCNGPASQPFALTMDEAGYGPNTGLAQAIFLSEPTVFHDLAVTDPQTVPFAEGNNIYVLGNQAVRELWDGDIDEDAGHQLDADVDLLVSELQDFVTSEFDVDEGDIGIHQPGADIGLDSDYNGQCGESTGGFFSSISFTHTCELGCEGDTIATMYSYEVNETAATLGGGEIPSLVIDGDKHTFADNAEDSRWFDIDAFDGDETRNEERDPTPPIAEE